MHGINRSIKPKILELLEFFPAVALLGPRQCGKTTLAHDILDGWDRPTVYLDLENTTDHTKLDDCVGYLSPMQNNLVAIDEVQNRPSLFPEIRGLIDEGRRNGITSGRFLFLGSASYELLRQSGESLAGRIAYLELTPFRLPEVGVTHLDKLWNRGGFPDSFLAPSEAMSREWRRNFIDTYLARDLGLFDRVGSLPAMRDLLQMIAHLHGHVLNVSQLAKAHDFGRNTINNYLDLFEQTFVIRRLPPFLKNVGKRLTKRPKIYIRDSGLLHQLLNIPDDDTLRGHPMRGESWEGFIIEHIISLLPDWSPFFYRTSHGAEMDLVMLQGNRRVAFEIKTSTAPTLSKGFYLARQDIAPEQTFVVSRTNDTWNIPDNITHTHAADLKNILLSL